MGNAKRIRAGTVTRAGALCLFTSKPVRIRPAAKLFLISRRKTWGLRFGLAFREASWVRYPPDPPFYSLERVALHG